jgi:hypothetical protein
LKVEIEGGRVQSLRLEIDDDLGLGLLVGSNARIGALRGMLNLKGEQSSSSSGTGQTLGGRGINDILTRCVRL